MARRPLFDTTPPTGIIKIFKKDQTHARARAGARPARPCDLNTQTEIQGTSDVDQIPQCGVKIPQCGVCAPVDPTHHNARCGAADEYEAFVCTALETGEWEGARPKHFVRLYGMLHQRVYGVEARELRNSLTVRAATRFATMLFQSEFSNDAAEMADFMRWTWEREMKREEWRRSNNRSGGRVDWRLQFGPSFVTDWRIDVARRNGQ